LTKDSLASQFKGRKRSKGSARLGRGRGGVTAAPKYESGGIKRKTRGTGTKPNNDPQKKVDPSRNLGRKEKFMKVGTCARITQGQDHHLDPIKTSEKLKEKNGIPDRS